MKSFLLANSFTNILTNNVLHILSPLCSVHFGTRWYSWAPALRYATPSEDPPPTCMESLCPYIDEVSIIVCINM